MRIVIGRRLGTPWRERPFPLHPLLVAAYPVLFLYGQNLGELELPELVGPLAAIVVAALAALVVGAYLLRDGQRAAVVVSALAATLLRDGTGDRPHSQRESLAGGADGLLQLVARLPDGEEPLDVS